MRYWLLLTASLSLLIPACAEEQPNARLYLVAQQDYGKATGFYLDLEGGTLRDLPIILGVGDGKEWRFPQHRPGFAPNRPHHVRAVISPERAQLFLDGVLVADSPGRWQPAEGLLTVNERPEWMPEVGDWLAELGTLTVTLSRDGRQVTRQQFPGSPRPPVALQLFQPDDPDSRPFVPRPGDAVTVDLTITFRTYDLHSLAPLIDRYGQCRYADWPGRVRSDDDLKHDIEDEAARLAAMPSSPDFDSYGGCRKAGWREHATGFFRVTKRDGFWWLLSPEGNPTFYLGVSSAPSTVWTATPVTGREYLFEWLPDRSGRYASTWGHDDWGRGENADFASLYACNLVRKYGDTWQRRATEQSVRRLRSWGFSGGGKWGTPEGLVETPVVSRGGVPNLVDHPDVFDPAVQEAFRAKLAEQITPRRRDPRVLGWAVGSEKDELIQPDEVTGVLRMAETVRAKRALMDYALETRYLDSLDELNKAWGTSAKTREELYRTAPAPSASDVEAMRLHYADKYYQFVYQTVKAIDPNHLYLGCYLCPVCAEREEDWRLAARHTDVVSYDLYTPTYGNERLQRLEAELDKPAFCGEFSYPAWYDGQRGFGRFRVSARDDAEAGERYRAWVQAAARDPYCVGGSWFEYRDQPITGRGPGYGARPTYGEHFAFGLVGETDRPKWEMVARMREANLRAAHWRMEAARQRQ
jgi:hypothetical protein